MTTQYLAFGTGGSANTLPYSTYAALTSFLSNGFQPGIVNSPQFNTLMRQVSVGVAGVALFASNNGQTMNDDGSSANFASNLGSAIASLMVGSGSALAALTPGASTAATGTISMSGYINRPGMPKRQFAVIQCSDTQGSSNQTWTFPNSSLFATGITAIRSHNMATMAGQAAGGGAAPGAGLISLAAQSATSISFSCQGTLVIGTKFWMYVEVEGY